MTPIFAMFGTTELIIIAFIAMLLFGNRFPRMMRSLALGATCRCPYCGWLSLTPHCPHCRHLKASGYPLNSLGESAQTKLTTERDQTRIRFPRWVIALAVIAYTTAAVDLIWSVSQGQSSDAPWNTWRHWIAFALVILALISVSACIAIAVRLRNHHERE